MEKKDYQKPMTKVVITECSCDLLVASEVTTNVNDYEEWEEEDI